MPRIPTRLIALLAAAAAALLTGCAAAVVGGAAASSALIITNRRSPGTQVSDQTIELRTASRAREILGDDGRVNIISYYRKVLLTGEVPTEEVRQRLQAAVAETPEVVGVVNELAVMAPTSINSRSQDSLLTGRVKANLVNTRGVPSNSIKVVTARGSTYLMGRLTQQEADLATEAARTTNGVQRVVRIIDIISTEEARRVDGAGYQEIQPKQAPVTSISDPATSNVTTDSQAVQVQDGAVTHPVTQPVMVKQPPVRVDVEQLPPAD